MSHSSQWFREVESALQAKRRLVTAVIVQTKGSTPRKEGTRMAVMPDGSILGTIGGGSFEEKVRQDALKLFEEPGTALRHYDFHPDAEGRGEAICGGDADVFFEYFQSSPTLLVYGAGHCGQALLQAAGHLGYVLEVADDRPELIEEVRQWESPRLRACHLIDTELTRLPSTDPETMVVIMTRNHEFDECILRQVVRQPFAYLGMIASKSKSKIIRDRLVADGFRPEELARVHMPIGVPIHSQTPAEIAVSVLAEIIAFRNGPGEGKA